MKLERCDDKELLTKIRRSYWNVPAYKKREGPFSTRLFKFERLDCEDFSLHWSATMCLKVTVLSTDQSYMATYAFSWGKQVWELWRVIE